MARIDATHRAAHSKTVIHGGFAFLISAFCLLGCGRDVATVWSAQSKSADGQWLATAELEEHRGPGNAGLQALVYIEPTDRSSTREAVFALSPAPGHGNDLKDLEMKWVIPTHLEIRYPDNATIDFEAVKAAGIDITYVPR